MAELTLRQAAAQVGVSRQTIYRMVKEGKLSATVRGDGQKVVDTAELLRAFGRLTPAPATGETVTRQGAELPRETGGATGQRQAPAGYAFDPGSTRFAGNPNVRAMTEGERRIQYETADREALRAELQAARDALQRADEQVREAREREAKLLDLLAGQTRLLEHKAEAEAPPPRGFWRRVFGK